MDILSEYSERLSELMGDMTTEQLGQAIGVNGSAVRHWKEKKNCISLSNAIAVADYFGCSLAYLFGRTDNVLDFAVQPQKAFYAQLRAIMASKGVSRYRFCKETHVSHGHFGRWKAGADPSMDTVMRIADYLDVTPDRLAGRET